MDIIAQSGDIVQVFGRFPGIVLKVIIPEKLPWKTIPDPILYKIWFKNRIRCIPHQHFKPITPGE
jgi:hypothetical protein